MELEWWWQWPAIYPPAFDESVVLLKSGNDVTAGQMAVVAGSGDGDGFGGGTMPNARLSENILTRSLTYTHTHTRTDMHTHTRARTHVHTHTLTFFTSQFSSFGVYANLLGRERQLIENRSDGGVGVGCPAPSFPPSHLLAKLPQYRSQPSLYIHNTSLSAGDRGTEVLRHHVQHEWRQSHHTVRRRLWWRHRSAQAAGDGHLVPLPHLLWRQRRHPDLPGQ